jgi:hypothetical protein
MDYNRSVFRQYWMPDSNAKECYECHKRFTTFLRRHHCRFCGQIFCGKCCIRKISGAELGYSGMLRLCNYCLERVGIYYEPECRTASTTPIPGSPSTSDKVRRKNSLLQSSQTLPTTVIEPSISDIPDTLNTDEKPLSLSLQSNSNINNILRILFST